MGLVEQFNALFWGWLEMLRALRRGVALAPLLVYSAAQALVLVAVVLFAYPPFSAVAAPLLERLFGPQALHYPNNLFVARAAVGQADLLMSVLLGPLTLGAAVVLFAGFYTGSRERVGTAFRWSAASYVPLLGVTALTTALSQGAARLPVALWGHLADESPTRFRLLRMATVAVVLAIQALFVYAVPAIAAGRVRFGAGLAGSLRLAVRQPLTTYLVVAVPAALELLPAWLARQSHVIATRLSPEALIAVMVLWIAVILAAGYAAAGAATRLFIHSTDDIVHGIAAGRGA
jgi:hypothetical protein